MSDREKIAKWLYYYGIIVLNRSMPKWEDRTQPEKDLLMSKADQILTLLAGDEMTDEELINKIHPITCRHVTPDPYVCGRGEGCSICQYDTNTIMGIIREASARTAARDMKEQRELVKRLQSILDTWESSENSYDARVNLDYLITSLKSDKDSE